MSTNRFKFNPEDDLAPLLHFLIVLSGIIVGIYFIISAVITAHSPNFTNDNYQIIEHSEEPLLQNETQNETLEPWMVGNWIGEIATIHPLDGPITQSWKLNILSKSGKTQQVVISSNNPYFQDIEWFNLKYDRNSQQLYYIEGSIRINIEVNSQTKTLYLPSEHGTLYLNK
ncbi:MAG: hypothetical protein IKY67_04260 [Paludibacteraceae bacterium]|nr:hypothetical protein [Paludibacteraceae bacterium]MBR5823335.1 hypothetical protein [Paludibacteraceae bacterium]